jgi:hypothetical protein
MARRGGRMRTTWTIVVTLAALLAACNSPAGTAADPPRSSVTAMPTQAATPGRSAQPTTGPPPDPPPESRVATVLPGGGRTLFPGRRIVAFYGTAGIPAMGVLGSAPPDQLWPRLAATARRLSARRVRVLPTYELIAVIASAGPGPDGMYRSRVAGRTIDRYLATVRKHQGLLLLDVQPGRADFLTEVRRLERWLREPDVALALDPEWRMGPGEVPARTIGSVTAGEVNRVSGWLDELSARHRLPQKLLLVHQFTMHMVTGKSGLQRRRNLAMVFNMDGFGGRAAKLAKYRMLAADRRFGLGLKLFYKQDIHMFGPADVLALRPAPSVVEYQ